MVQTIHKVIQKHIGVPTHPIPFLIPSPEVTTNYDSLMDICISHGFPEKENW